MIELRPGGLPPGELPPAELSPGELSPGACIPFNRLLRARSAGETWVDTQRRIGRGVLDAEALERRLAEGSVDGLGACSDPDPLTQRALALAARAGARQRLRSALSESSSTTAPPAR